jgi:4-hydroxymandelate oxidase
MDAINVTDLERLARERLDRSAYDYYSSGAEDERTLIRNRRAFDELELHYRVLVDVSKRDPSTEVLGTSIALPVMIAPTAFHRLAHPDGELATARAAGAAGTIMILSSLSNTRIEEVVPSTRAPIWFQLYVYKDRGATEALIARAEAAGARAIVLTVDAPLLGTRERDVRNRFQLPEGLAVENMVAAGYGAVRAPPSGSGLAAYFASLIDPALEWKDLAWLRSRTKLPLVLKGLVRADDARRAVDSGVDAIVVSNHGGRQLDGSPATISVLPSIADAVGGRIEILLDGGVRRGTDVLKALALGAKAVLVGRPVLWGLAVSGQSGVERVLSILRSELDLAMALAGVPRPADATSDLVRSTARGYGDETMTNR